MTLLEKIRSKVLGMVGLAKDDKSEEDRLTFINDSERITKARLREYNIWYYGDGDELLNFYTHQNITEYNVEPWYSRNKRNYFWSISSTENDIKRSHSGQPRNIVDTLVAIVKYPKIEATGTVLDQILKDCNFKNIYKGQQLPLTLVEGWGCYKINWDLDISEYPYPVYYRAENVDFVIKAGRIIGVIFKDYYTDGDNRKYLLLETRSCKTLDNKRCLVIERELFKADRSGDFITPIYDFSEVPELAGMDKKVVFENMKHLLAVPSILFDNTSNAGGYGRSIFTGKIDLFDDLDQCLSQAANTVRRSTAVEYYNTDFLERDSETGMPKQPKSYDRKYVMYAGQRGADGGSTSSEPVQVTQPNLDFAQYSDQAIQILIQIINGVMSPATLGIDIAKKDNAEAQREKEKVTIFTRNWIIDSETDIVKSVCEQLLCAYEYMKTGKITKFDYNITVKYSEFADDSYENKLEKLGEAFDSELLSEKMFMDRLYGDSLSAEEYERELNWLKENHTKPKTEGMKGAFAGEMLGGDPDEEMEL